MPANELSFVTCLAPSVPKVGPLGVFRADTMRQEMKKEIQPAEHSEPLGIIISNGERAEYPTVFSAYIWGPAPEPTIDPASKAA
jgi:hypothetical protein